MRQYLDIAQVVTPATVAPVIPADPDDDHVLACALVAKADLIVSGDRHLLRLQRYQESPIVTAGEAVRRIEPA